MQVSFQPGAFGSEKLLQGCGQKCQTRLDLLSCCFQIYYHHFERGCWRTVIGMVQGHQLYIRIQWERASSAESAFRMRLINLIIQSRQSPLDVLSNNIDVWRRRLKFGVVTDVLFRAVSLL